jgi:hypothetical protein
VIGIISKELQRKREGSEPEKEILLLFVLEEDTTKEQFWQKMFEIRKQEPVWSMWLQMLDLPFSVISASAKAPPSDSTHAVAPAEMCFARGVAYQACSDCILSRDVEDTKEFSTSFRIFDRLAPHRLEIMQRQLALFRSCLPHPNKQQYEHYERSKTLPKIFIDVRSGSRGIRHFGSMIDQLQTELLSGGS